jgi:uncharacterized membrane protein YhaH (DUF805 family)
MSYEAQGGEPPLEWPYYGIGFGAAVKRWFAKYATFDGRASRGEYWWVALFNGLLGVVLYAVLGIILATTMSSSSSAGSAPQLGAGYYAVSGVYGLYSLATLVPSISVAVRRLHDTGRSGWNYLLGLIPLVGPIILIVFFAQATTPSAERYGPPRSQYAAPGDGAGAYGQGYPSS